MFQIFVIVILLIAYDGLFKGNSEHNPVCEVGCACPALTTGGAAHISQRTDHHHEDREYEETQIHLTALWRIKNCSPNYAQSVRPSSVRLVLCDFGFVTEAFAFTERGRVLAGARRRQISSYTAKLRS